MCWVKNLYLLCLHLCREALSMSFDLIRQLSFSLCLCQIRIAIINFSMLVFFVSHTLPIASVPLKLLSKQTPMPLLVIVVYCQTCVLVSEGGTMCSFVVAKFGWMHFASLCSEKEGWVVLRIGSWFCTDDPSP